MIREPMEPEAVPYHVRARRSFARTNLRRRRIREPNKGQATLSFVLIVSGIIIEIAIAGSFIAYFLSNAGLGERLSARALAASEAGLRDAAERVARNKDSCASTCLYNFAVGSDAAAITVTRTDDPTDNIYFFSITSLGTAGTRERQFVETLSVNKTTGVVGLSTITEQPLP